MCGVVLVWWVFYAPPPLLVRIGLADLLKYWMGYPCPHPSSSGPEITQAGVVLVLAFSDYFLRRLSYRIILDVDLYLEFNSENNKNLNLTKILQII